MAGISAHYEFDGLDCFNLSTKRMQAAFEIASLLLDLLPSDFLSKAPDDSIVDALAYEILRLYVASQASWEEWEPYEWESDDPEDLLRHLNNPPRIVKSDNGKSVPKSIRAAFTSKNFQFLTELSVSSDFSPQFLSDLRKMKSLSDVGTMRIRREIHSKNINGDPKKAGPIPFWVTPTTIRSVLFFYRWCLLLAHSHGFYRAQSLRLYEEVKDRFAQKVQDDGKTVMNRRYKNFYNALLLIGSEQVDQPRSIEKRISEMNLSWAIEFMHSDYVGLINWKNLGEMRSKNFLSEFVSNDLGGHLLEARIGNKWSVGDPSWEKALRKKGKIVPRIRSIGSSKKCDQVFTTRKENHCFDYLLDYDPTYRAGILTVHDIRLTNNF